MRRKVQPEILDTLPPDHPDALHNRRDLRITNRFMGNHRWLERMLSASLRSGERVLEIGAGCGELGARLALRGIVVDGLDLWPRPAIWPAGGRWHRVDLREFEAYDAYDVIVANLILHQFTTDELARLGPILQQRARILIACEPVRSRVSQVLFAGVAPLLGANHVSRHDGHVSIAAGFRNDELPGTLGLAAENWDVRCSEAPLGAYRMIAARRSPGNPKAKERLS
ncbi:MAG TPA: hypothetical protein VHD32_18440 [Candidatus Didemnitutus sp.]|nr:hypothetical protein [Candidatus Didemnitutus sp.]